MEAALVVVFAALTVALAWSGPLTDADVWLRDVSDAHRPAGAYWLARLVNLLGNGGWVMTVTLLLAVVLAWRRRTVRPVFPAGAAAVLTAGLIVPLKRFTDRPAPHYFGPAEAFSVPGRESYPSGHLMNTVVWFGVLALLLAPYAAPAVRRALRVLPSVLVFASTIYLGFHWFTDDVAGLALGILCYRVICRVPWSAIPLPTWLERRPQPAERPWP
ncbi:MAG TPA: phosphatase PAP2 family protein [Actinocatenispora sp.]